MNSHVRLQAKRLLSGSTLRLFLISGLSLILRWGYVVMNVGGTISLIRGDTFARILARYNDGLVYSVTVIAYLFALYLMLSTTAALRMGERFVYYTRAQGGKGRLALLFKFMNIRGGFRAFRLYTTLNILKLLWLTYFLLPPILCGACIAYLYVLSKASAAVLTILLTGEGLLISLSLVMWRVCSLRYDGAVYYLCLRDISVRKAIKKSTQHTDGVLSDGVVLEYSLLGWILSGVLILPLIYTIPYIKLCKATFVTEAVFRGAPVKSTYAMSFFPLSGKHINECG